MTHNPLVQSLAFIELPRFTWHVYDYPTYHPNAGAVVRDSGGCRKLRWGARGRGKRGGVQVIYYYRQANGEMWMLTIYAKIESENIPGHVLRRLREEIDNG